MQSVVHLVSADETEQQTGLAIARNLLEDEQGSIDDVVVAAQAGGIETVLAGGDLEDQVRSLMDDGVPFRACTNTLDAREMDSSDLVDGVETVPEVAVEVTRLQEEGYGYLRP